MTGQERKIILRPEKIQFTGNGLRILHSGFDRYTIPYKRIIRACVSIYDRQSGTCYEPEITEITGEMEGDLLLYDCERRRWRLQTELTDRKAGAMIEELVMRAPYILIGGGWFDLDNEEDFDQLTLMTRLMRESLSNS